MAVASLLLWIVALAQEGAPAPAAPSPSSSSATNAPAQAPDAPTPKPEAAKDRPHAAKGKQDATKSGSAGSKPDASPTDPDAATSKSGPQKPVAAKPGSKPASSKPGATASTKSDSSKPPSKPSKPPSKAPSKQPSKAPKASSRKDGPETTPAKGATTKGSASRSTKPRRKPSDGAEAAAEADDSAPPKKKPVVVPTPRPKAPEIPSYKVSLRMKSGRRFIGVVSRDKAFHDLVHAGSHHAGDAYERDERFMLRFVDGLDGDLELCWNQVARLEVRDVLDSAGVRAMEATYAGMRIARETRSGAPVASSDGIAPPATGAEPADDETVPDVPQDGDAGEISLFTEFSPRAGWTPERKRQIEWRRTVIGSFPDAREQRFLDVFEAWLPLYEEWQRNGGEDAEKKEGGEGEPAPPPGDGDPGGDPAAPADDAPEADRDAPDPERDAADPEGDSGGETDDANDDERPPQ